MSAIHRGTVEFLDPSRPHLPVLRAALPRTGPDPLEQPAVGDYARLRTRGDVHELEALAPRRSIFIRRAAGTAHVAQLVAANIDLVLIVCAIGEELNLRRLERYLVAVRASGADALIVVNKADRAHDPEALFDTLGRRLPGCRALSVSGLSGAGLDQLRLLLPRCGTVALMGSSGVGKSTLVNQLLGREAQDTGAIRPDDEKGRHTTTSRQLLRGPDGLWLIDTPGMRELGLWKADDGLEALFGDVLDLEARCRFRDCAHDTEPGCAVQQAIEEGRLDPERLVSFRKLQRELARSERKVRERDDKLRRRRTHQERMRRARANRQRRKMAQRMGLKGW